MSDLPQRIDLPTPRIKLALLAALMVACAVGLALSTFTPAGWIGWLMAVPPAAMAVVFLLGIVHGVGVSLDGEGFTVHSLWSSERRHLWKDVSEFKIGRRGKVRAIRFDDTTRTGTMSDFRHAMGRGNSWVSPLVVSGGLRNACDLMNAFRNRALK